MTQPLTSTCRSNHYDNDRLAPRPGRTSLAFGPPSGLMEAKPHGGDEHGAIHIAIGWLSHFAGLSPALPQHPPTSRVFGERRSAMAVLAVPDTADGSAPIELCVAKRANAAGRPESECGTVTSYQRHRAARSKPPTRPARQDTDQNREYVRQRKEMAQ